ncbi:carboxymuconolactone decarboxylase family protein [Salinibacter ruber]|jgi:AhpD family alkylhydroperoxidase|uniref:carboxymuconolactone decarboxylase family protein n=1 Tax=Salinibacter ruber TaxID=146919 RepID=UPI0021693894|nr:carboxymuconolactone decarboxylase family protein [Salinibacter ruber]MCS4057924.1 AhpD family alkylhydroperoxidase [Salinibacter ruber]
MASTTTPQTDHAEQVHEKAEQALGFVPNLITEITGENPAVAEAYLTATGIVEDGGVLSDAEQQAVILAASSYNDCHYCTKAHAAAGQQAGLDTETVESINEGGLPGDDRLKSLVRATRRILGKRGWLSDDDEAEFADLGLNRPELYEIVGLVGIKTISNYVNHIAETEIDEPFQQ